MSATYLRELEHARRDISELFALVHLAGPADLTITQLAEAIGLASMAHAALLRAAAARETKRCGHPVSSNMTALGAG